VRRALWAAVVVVLVAATAWADGIVVPSQAAAKPARTPDQRALVAFDGSTETLVIETTLAGEGRDFAWIVPLPAAPKIEESTSGLFPTLEAMTGPTVETHLDHEWIAVALCGLIALALVRWGGRDTPWPLAVLFAYFAVGTVLAVFTVGAPKMQATDSAGDAGAARVLSRESVGAFDTAVLAVPDAKTLRAWLDANAFRAPDGVDAVVADYVAKGWVFVASKIRRADEDDRVRAVRPLAFTFATTNCVYPMRLTGVGADSLAVELFVFGPSRAEATGLGVEYCRGIWDRRMSAGFGECHAELFRRVSGAVAHAEELGGAAVTKLVGTLDRDAMRDDVELRWVPTKSAHVEYVSSSVALSRAADFGIGAFFAALVFAETRRRRRGSGAGPSARRLVGAATAIGLAVGAVVWTLLPRLPSNAWEMSRHGGPDAWTRLDAPHEPIRDVASARALLASRTVGVVNPYTREPVREEDSPGNYVVRDADGKIELVLYWADSRFATADRLVVDLSAGPRPGRDGSK
jgi:hypothetical protein